MARSDTRYSVYPAPRAVEIVGSSAPALNQAIECWAALLVRAMADNRRTISQGEWVCAGVGGDVRIGLKEWSFLACVLKGRPFDPEYANPGDLLATAVEDAHRLENAAVKWFVTGTDFENVEAETDADVGKLVERLRKLDYVHAWAVIAAIRWFWEHHEEGIDIEKDTWWTLPFRRKWHQARAKKSPNRKSPP